MSTFITHYSRRSEILSYFWKINSRFMKKIDNRKSYFSEFLSNFKETDYLGFLSVDCIVILIPDKLSTGPIFLSYGLFPEK